MNTSVIRYWVEVDENGRVIQTATTTGPNPPAKLRNGDIHEVTQFYDPNEIGFDNGHVYFVGQPPSPFHVYDYAAREWIDPRSIEDLRDQKWEEIKRARADAEFAGFTWDGSTFDSDSISQQRIQGAIQLAQLASAGGQPFEIEWTLQDNTTRVLDPSDLAQVGIALGTHVAYQHVKGRLIRDELQQLTTAEDIASVQWIS